MRNLHAREVDALLLEDLHLPRPGGDGGHRVGHDRSTGLDARARDRAVDLFHALGDAGRVGGALEEGCPDVGPLNALLQVGDEVLGHRVDVAVLEVVREVVVAVDAGARDNPHAGLIGDLLHEMHVPPAEHGCGLDDGLHAALLCGGHRGQRRVEFELCVVSGGPLGSHGLVAEAHVLVREHNAQLVGLHCALHGLNGGHSVGQSIERARRPARRRPRARVMGCGHALLLERARGRALMGDPCSKERSFGAVA